MRLQWAGIKVEPVLLAAVSVKIEVQATRHEGHQDQVAQIHLPDPAPGKRADLVEGRLEPDPDDNGEHNQDRVLRDVEPARRDPADKSHGVGRPVEKRRDPDRHLRAVMPLAVKLAHSTISSSTLVWWVIGS